MKHPISFQQIDGSRNIAERYLRTGPQMFTGIVVMGCMFAGASVWAATARLDGAVLATGQVAIDGKRKTLQHQFGGTIDKILIRDGDRVRKDQVLLRLKKTDEGSKVAVLRDQLLELMVRRARLLAERRGDASITLPQIPDSPKLAGILYGQRVLFDSRRASRLGEEALIKQRTERLHKQIGGLENQRKSNTRQISFIERELKGLRVLAKKGLVRRPRLYALEREAERIRGLSAALTAQIAQSRNAVDELGAQRLQLVRQLEEQVTTELREIEPSILSLWEQFVAAEQKLAATKIRAPVAGTIVGLQVNTKGGVITPGADILDIVPTDAKLVLRAQVGVTDVDRIAVGMPARIRFTAFDAATTPEARGNVVSVSADALVSSDKQRSYYEVLVALSPKQPAAIKRLALVPGMPVEVFIQTGERSPLSYLVKPLSDRFARALVEE
ncbi:MAG: HlyD family type I secretion periplasmic adaptor subunit [Methyloligellaceae bacterium]